MPDKTPQNLNREAWLTQFVALSLPLIRKRTGLTLPEGTFQISCGFPSKGGTRAKNKTIGQCHCATGEGRKKHQLFIHPELIDPIQIGGVALHEVLHAMLPIGVGHRKPFSQAAKKLGLMPDKDDPETKKHGVPSKATATYASAELVERIQEIVEQLGDYPHEALTGGYGPKQGTRLLKVMCPLCGYICRTTSKWVDDVGAPICPQCQIPMEESGVGDQATCPLVPVQTTTLYQVKATIEARKAAKLRNVDMVYDPRWFISMQRNGTDAEWRVVDTGPAIDDKGMAVFGTVAPRYAIAEGREDAVALLESLRDGSMDWGDLEVDDDDPKLDLGDADPDYEDEDETSDTDPYTDAEMAIYEQERKDRENGRGKAKKGYRPPLTESQIAARIRELEQAA